MTQTVRDESLPPLGMTSLRHRTAPALANAIFALTAIRIQITPSSRPRLSAPVGLPAVARSRTPTPAPYRRYRLQLRYNSAFLTTRDGVVLFDAPPTIGHNIQRAIDEIANANGVSNTVTYIVHSHHHADHGGASS